MTMEPFTAGQGMKPTWRGLRSGGAWRTPLSEFVGRLESWSTDPGTFGVQIKLNHDRVQVIRSDAPYASPEATIEIKYSDQANSGWGRCGDSVAKVLGVERDYLDIDQLVNQILHWVRHDEVDYGFVDKEGKKATGTVWELVEILLPGAAVIPAAVPASTPVAPMVATANPAVATTATAAVAPSAGTAEDQALRLLHGRNLGEFFQAALPDPLIRADAALSSAILNNTFVTGKVTSGEVEVNAEGVYIVKALVSPERQVPF